MVGGGEYSLNLMKCQTAHPFPDVSRWLFIVPVVRDKIVILHGYFEWAADLANGSLKRAPNGFSEAWAWPVSQLG